MVRLTRAALSDPHCEHYRLSHDPIMTVLGQVQGAPALDISKLINGNKPLSVCFGGINDGRHVYGTIMDIYLQFQRLSMQQHQDQFRGAHVFVNDINPAAIARSLLAMIMLHKVGESVKHFEDLQANDDALRWCTVLQYVMLVYTMPAWVNDQLLLLMEEVLQCQSSQDLVSRFPWLSFTTEKDFAKAHRCISI